MRRAGSYIAFALWFAVIGPLVVFPIPTLLLGAHVMGFIPASLTGIALGYRYRQIPPPATFWGRAVAGFQVGCTTSFICYVIGALVYRLGGFGYPGASVHLWLEGAVPFGIFFTLIGAVAGAFAFSVLPESLRNSVDNSAFREESGDV